MNLFNVSYKVLSVIDKLVYTIISIYIIYFLFSPGLYLFLVLYIIGMIGYVIISIKVKNEHDKLYNEIGYVEMTEREYASTYRKRYYNKLYLVIVVLLLLISTCCLCNIVYKQFDTQLNKKFVDSIEYFYDEMGTNEDIFIRNKVVPIVPNVVKELLIESVDSVKWVNDLIAVVSELSETEDEETIRGIVEARYIEMEERQERIDKLGETFTFEILFIVLTIMICKYSFKECLDYTKHRSIELKE